MRSFACCAAAVLVAAVPAAAEAAPRGTPLDSTRVAHQSATQTARTLREAGLPSTIQHGIDAYRLRYATVDPSGQATSASALVVLPRGGTPRPATVIYGHGTIVRRRDAPSQGLDSLAGSAAVLSAAKGFVTVAPDYLRLGSGPGRQAYLEARTEASASIDALRAARTFTRRRGRPFNTRVLASGFSQGGQAAMALGRALQTGPGFGLRLGAIAAISGPYDLQGVELPAILDGQMDERISAYNLSLLLTSWRALYGLPADAFQNAWARRVARLLDGRHSDPQVLAALPPNLSDLLTAAQLERLRHPTGALLQGLRANDRTCAWRPRVPVRLYAASGDRAVAFANSRSCAAQLRAHRTPVRLVDVGRLDHFPSMFAAVPQALAWFTRLAPRGA